MAAFWQQRGRRQENGGLGSVIDGLGSVFDVLLANARLVLGVSGAAVLAIATLAVKRVRLGRGSEHGKMPRRAGLAPVWWGKMCPKPRCLLLSWFLAYGTDAKCHGSCLLPPCGTMYPYFSLPGAFGIQHPIPKGTWDFSCIWVSVFHAKPTGR